tara:strand:+ start:197 stop:598 length:402 start_codon:yes stop_codon:yes gene_type:complete
MKENPDGTLTYKGVNYPGVSALQDHVNFDPGKWFIFWKQKAVEIKKQRFELHQLKNIHKSFVHELLTYTGTRQMVELHQELNQLSSELQIAFQMAYSNHRDSRKGVWGFVSGLFAKKFIDKLKVPTINMAGIN